MANYPSATINTRYSVATQRKLSGLVESYSYDSMLGGVWPYIRGRRFVDCKALSDPKDQYSIPSGGGKKGGDKKGGGSSEDWYGRILYRVALGPMPLLHCIKVDDVTVFKNQDGASVPDTGLDIRTDRGDVTIYKGTWEQSTDPDWPGASARRGKVYMAWHDLKLGSDRLTVPSIKVEGTFGDAAEDGLYSLGDILTELYTDPRIGLGAPASSIDIDENLIYNTRKFAVKIEDETNLQDFLDENLPLVFCRSRFDGQKLVVKQEFDAIDWETVPSIGPRDWIEKPKILPESPTEKVSEVVVVWKEQYDGDEGDDAEGERENVSIYRDPARRDVPGKTVTIQANNIITRSIANNIALTKGAALALSKSTAKVSIPRGLFPYASTAIGSPIKLYDPKSSRWLRMRVVERSINFGEPVIDLDLDLDVTSSIHDSATIGYVAPSFYKLEPVDPQAVRLLELPRPFGEQVGVGVFCARGSRQVDGFGMAVSLDDGITYDYAGGARTFATYGTLQSVVSASDGTFVVGSIERDADLYESVSTALAEADTLIALIGNPPNHELVSVRLIQQDGGGQITLTALRGRLGSIAAAHVTGAPVFLIRRSLLPVITAPLTEPTPLINTALDPSGGREYLVRLPQKAGGNVQVTDDCTDWPISINGTYRRPISPFAISLDGGRYTAVDMTFQVDPQLWRSEGYAAADFYELTDITIVPVIEVNGLRTVLAERPYGVVTISAAEMATALEDTISSDFTIEFFTFTAGRHSSSGSVITLTRDYIVQLQPVGTSGGVIDPDGLDPVDIDGLDLIGSSASVFGGGQMLGMIRQQDIVGNSAAALAGALRGQDLIDEVPLLGDPAACIDGQSVRGRNVKVINTIGNAASAFTGSTIKELGLPAEENLVWQLDSDYADDSSGSIVWPTVGGELVFQTFSGSPIIDRNDSVNGHNPIRVTNDQIRSTAYSGLPVGAANPKTYAILVKSNSTGTGYGYLCGFNTSGEVSFLVNSSGLLSYERWPTVYPSSQYGSDGEWHWLTIVYNGSTFSLYDGATLIRQDTITASDSLYYCSIGCRSRYTNAKTPDASFLQVLTWNKALTVDEIAQAAQTIGRTYNLTLT